MLRAQLILVVTDSFTEKIQFARANALASYKGKTMRDITRSADIVNHTRREMALHIRCCEEFGISEDEILNRQENQGRKRVGF
jgi:thiaminase